MHTLSKPTALYRFLNTMKRSLSKTIFLIRTILILSCSAMWFYSSSQTFSDLTNQLSKSENNLYAEPTIKKLLESMVFVKGKSFTMGCKDETGRDCESSELPPHKAEVGDFWISKFEVTRELWYFVTKQTEPECKNCPPPKNNQVSNPTLPIDRVSWEEAQDFIEKLNELLKMKFRLPTEAEWEFAAGGGKEKNPKKWAGTNNPKHLFKYANFCDKQCGTFSSNKTQNDGFEGLAPVGSFKPNLLGLYDMSGNISEWCSDKYKSYGSDDLPQSNSDEDEYYIIRGGNFYSSDVNDCRVNSRKWEDKYVKFFTFGLRLAHD